MQIADEVESAPGAVEAAPTEEVSLSWMEAEALRKAGQWARAGAYFHACLKKSPSAGAAWRYAFCLRKAGYPEAALGVARRAIRTWPDQNALRWELVWCLYAARLQPAQQREGQEEKVLEAAREMVAEGAEGLAPQLVVFAAVGAARRRGQWGEVLSWCERLSPEGLDARPQEGRKQMAPLERWHLARVKALTNLERWEEGVSAARQARDAYPHSPDFLRWHAACLAGQGKPEEAAAILQEHLGARRKQWYVLADLARLRLELGDVASGRALAEEAVVSHGEDSAKVNLFLLLARIHCELGDFATAGNWLGWCLQLRSENAWPARAIHQDVLASIEQAGVELPHRSSREWKEICLSSLAAGQERRSGRVEGCGDERPFCFIRDKSDRFFVLVRDLPADCRKDGAKVDFVPVQGFDKKKGRPAWQAGEVKKRG